MPVFDGWLIQYCRQVTLVVYVTLVSCMRIVAILHQSTEKDENMSKGQDSKKATKKVSEKSLKEKRAEKKAKQEAKKREGI